MGQKGTMSALRRTSAGLYTEADAHTLEEILAAELDTEPVFALEELYKLMNAVLEKKQLREVGVTADELPVYAKTVLETQQRLLNNNYVELTEEDILSIYTNAF